MNRRSTGDLTQALMDTADLNEYLSENDALLLHDGVAELLNDLCMRKRLAKASLAREAGMSEVYLHQIISGRRRPSRDRVLCLCVAMGATLDEAQALLRQCGCAALYPKDRRDAIILYCLNRRKTLAETQELLQSMELTILGGDNGYGG